MAPWRRLCLVLLLAGLAGCETFTADLFPDELQKLADREKAQIQFAGAKAPMPKYSEKIGKVDGRICQATLLTPIDEFQALSAMWASAKGKNATAVIDAECGSSSFLLATGGAYCWPGYYCRGVAVK